MSTPKRKPKKSAQRWHTMAEKPVEEYGLFLVWAESADPKKPLRHMAFWSKEDNSWSGLVDHWLEHLSHWHPFPQDPK